VAEEEDDVEILAIAGGTPSGNFVGMFCCFFPILPLVGCLTGVAVARNSVWAAAFSLLLAALPFLLFLGEVAGYEPSSDPDEVIDQASAWKCLGLTACPVALAGLSLLWIAGKRLIRRDRVHAEPSSTSGWPEQSP
jgi:hypothetical protein